MDGNIRKEKEICIFNNLFEFNGMSEDKNIPQADGTENRKTMIKLGNADIEATIDKDGHIIMPNELMNVIAAGMAVMQQANGKTVETNDTDQTKTEKLGENISDKFKGLPMRELIGAPLFAAAEAQEKLASIAWDYYQKIAYDTDDNGKPKDTTRILKFDLERPVVQDGVVSADNNKVTVKAPFIGLVPIPSLLIDRVDVDFQMEVTDTNSSTDNKNTEASTNISSKWFGVNVGISGKVTSSRENTRSTNQTAKYQVHVTASQQPRTEGLAKLMDIMASCIEPVPTSDKSGGE